ncbi:MAG: hypothetical protein C4523_05345 [Myxococcales bacterium]|nr:MAG: hypothetical protein C4523_05345 [Myxococcales bacterium]
MGVHVLEIEDMKVTIYIPKELEEDFQKYHSNLKGKLSGIFARELKKEIEKMQELERNLERKDDRKLVVERIKAELEEARESDFQLGYTHGYNTAGGMHASNLQTVADYASDPYFFRDGMIADSIYEILDFSGFAVKPDQCKAEHGVSSPKRYIIGVIKGIAQFWREIKDEL